MNSFYRKNFYRDKNNIFIPKIQKKNRIKFLDHIEEEWNEIEKQSFWYFFRKKIVFSLIKKNFKKKEIIDIGSGSGINTLYFNEKGYETISIEPTYNLAINQIKNKIENVYCFDIQKEIPPKTTNIFPNITLLDVLEHIKKDEDFLKKLFLLLEKDGYMLITVPAFNFLWTSEDKIAGHYRRYTISKIKEQLKKNGFKVIYSSYFFSFLVLPILLFRKTKNIEERDMSLSKIHHSFLFKFMFFPFYIIEIALIKLKIKIPLGSSLIILCKK